MKQSAFNHVAALPEGGHVLYNFLTAKCMRLNFLSKDYLDNHELYGPQNPQVQRLRELGFLVDYDEHDLLRHRVRLACGDTHKLRLTVCPTLQCDFACPYCYETPRSGAMNTDVQDSLVSFTRETLSRWHSRSLEVVWYGGEPLLQPQIIAELSARLIGICEETGVTYEANIITNGYNLDERTSELLDVCKITSIQVTLDGPDAQTHDKTRHLRGGQGTFNRIMHNICNYQGNGQITVRCNVHQGNVDKYAELENRLLAMGRDRDKEILVYAGHMDGHGEYAQKSIAAEEFAAFQKETVHEVERVGYVGPVCMVPKMLDFVVDERGNLYKCLESVGRDEESIGNVANFNPELPSSMNADVLSGYYDFAWPDDEECMHCPILPTCMGGCPQRRLEGQRECSPIRFALDEYVIALGRELMSRGKD